MELKRKTFLLLSTSIATTVVLAGCAESNPNQATAANGGRFYAVTTDSAPFYRYGPQQGNGPDMKLQKDRLMTLIHPHLIRPEPRAFHSIRQTRAWPSRKSRFQNSTRNRLRFQVYRHPATRISNDECRRVLCAAIPFRHSCFGSVD